MPDAREIAVELLCDGERLAGSSAAPVDQTSYRWTFSHLEACEYVVRVSVRTEHETLTKSAPFIVQGSPQ